MMKSVRFCTPPNRAYQGNSPQELMNGLLGNISSHSGYWVGLVGNDMDVIIDLQHRMPIRSVSVRTLTEQSNQIFPDRGVSLLVSDDGEHFKEVFADTKQSLPLVVPPSVSTQKMTLENAKTRYLCIKALSKHSMPQWHYGYGQPAFSFVDEITVD